MLLANGWLPTRGSFMLDVVFVAMFVVVLVLLFSIYLVRIRRQFLRHRNIQVATAVVLVFAIVAFEIDVRFFTDWRDLAQPSPFFESGVVHWALWIHLCFAIPCPFVWAYVIWAAMTKFPKTVHPNEHSQFHRCWGRIAAFLMLMTALTGCTFYYLAFVA